LLAVAAGLLVTSLVLGMSGGSKIGLAVGIGGLVLVLVYFFAELRLRRRR